MEGWRKIAPLIDIIEQDYIPRDVQERMKLEMIPTEIFEKSVFLSAKNLLDSTQLRIKDSKITEKTIKDSWIYEHFRGADQAAMPNSSEQTNQSKIALYVSEINPINQNSDVSKINSVGNHCVIAKGLAKWPKKDPKGIECLELEIHGDSDEMRYIPVEFPFFEEIQIDINEIYQRTKNMGAYFYNRDMNKLGKKLALTKWKTVEDNWYDLKKKPKEGQEKDKENQRWKYGMIFIRGIYPCFQLKFTS